MARTNLKRGLKRNLRRRFPRRRRAMVLLVVLSLLAIFTLITVSFVLVASQGRITAQAAARMEQRGDEPRALLHEAMLQLVRGTNNRISVLQASSLLEDMYGNDRVTGMIADPTVIGGPAVSPVTSSGAVQIVRTTFDQQYNQPMPTGPVNIPTDPFALSTRLYRAASFNGCVLTMTSGPLKGRSTRIVDYQPNVVNPTTLIGEFQIAAFSGGIQPAPGDRFLVNGRPFNGAGFGLGKYQSAVPGNSAGLIAHLLRVTDNDPNLPSPPPVPFPRALLPNHVFTYRDNSIGYHSASANEFLQLPFDPAGPGGADESYDAPDYQNPHMAMRYWDTGVGSLVTRLPSFHRPDLINWWSHQLKDPLGQPFAFDNPAKSSKDVVSSMFDPGLAAVMRKAMLRPAPADHRYFPGNDPNGAVIFHPLWGYGTQPDPQWDVDNDGDGKRDSIWMDIGLPAQAMPDGRWYKPLVAVLCVDMDGRLNLNAHGNTSHIDLANYQPGAAAIGLPGPPLSGLPGPFASATPGNLAIGEFSFGQGYGPAEVNLRRALPVVNAFDTYQALLEGASIGGEALEGRYGERQGAAAAANSNIPRAGYTVDISRISDTYDVLTADPRLTMSNLSQKQMPFGYADAYVALGSRSQWLIDGYGSAPDLDGDGVLALDHRGQPYLATLLSSPGRGVHGFGEPGEVFSDPYELDLSRANARWIQQVGGSNAPTSPVDAPFTPDELEQILRRYDADADFLTSGSGMPTNQSRLISLVREVLVSNPRLDSILTTESWDVPASGASVYIDNLRVGASNARYPVRRVQSNTIQDLLAARLPVSMSAAQLNVAMRKLLPPELLAGRKMDLNRLFGNGRDDNSNGIVDEPGEADRETIAGLDRVMVNRPPLLAWLDADNDGEQIQQETAAGTTTNPPVQPRTPFDFDDAQARQQYAKHLYVLMMLLIDDEFRINRGWQDANGNHLEEVARRVAQWAVNVVDFRDRDSIITGFEYDSRPFTDESSTPDGDPWDVNGYIEKATDPPANPPEPNNARAIVWGCERPELLITEVIATHDRGTADEDVDEKTSATANADEDYDQVRRPRGNLLVELHNPGGPNDAPAPELYAQSSLPDAKWGVKLNAVTSNTAGPRSPVWRLATRKPDMHNGGKAPPQTLADPEHFRPVLDYPGEPNPVNVGQFIYFTTGAECTTPPSATPTFDRLSGTTPDVVRPGRFALIGAAGRSDPDNYASNTGRYYRMYFGQRQRGGAANSNGQQQNRYPYYVQLAGTSAGAGAGAPQRIGPYRQVAGDTYAFDLNDSVPPIVGLVIGPRVIGGNRMQQMSISEPDTGYDVSTITDAQLKFNPNAFFPAPLDNIDDFGNADLRLDDFSPRGTSMVYLERLADPTQPYDNLANPYITIDRMYVGLRTFRGEPDPTEAQAKGEFGGALVADTRPFDSFRRGSETGPAGRDLRRNLWSPWSAPDSTADVSTGTPSNPLSKSTLGGMNGIQKAAQRPADTEFGPGMYTQDQVAVGAGANPTVDKTDYYGSPYVNTANSKAIPWLTWNNRPYVSAMELLLVPSTTQPGLLLQHGIRETTNFDPFKALDEPTDRNSAFRAEFRHLLNLFNATSATGAAPQRGSAPDLYRLFDYVGVPSRFNGTVDVLHPKEFSGGNMHYLHPPYNQISRYREPGKINLNTVFDPMVWDALTDGAFGYKTTYNPTDPERWNAFTQSRQGYSGGYFFNSAYPTMFANPFRSAGDNPFVPLASLVQNKDVDVTLLRERPSGGGEPLLANRPFATGQSQHNDPDRNPYFRYAGLEKIYNSVTTRSNVYAIWITVGFFEVTPAPMGPSYPDGWQLGPEIGTDTGEIQRHRAFYLYDRTIPVGFERGETHNVEDGLLIQRYIE